MAKSYWETKAGRRAIQQQSATDAAGAMRVSPAIANNRGTATLPNTRAPAMGIDPVSLPGRGTTQTFNNKLITQGPTTGFGSFRNVERKATARSVAPEYKVR